MRIWIEFFVGVCLFGCAGFAQQVGFQDLSGPGTKPTEISAQSKSIAVSKPQSESDCKDVSVSFSDGELISEKPEKLKLKIVKTDRAKYTEGEELIADVKLENAGVDSVFIPFSIKGVDYDVNNDEKSYRSAGVELNLETGDRGDSDSNTLLGDANFQGSNKTEGSVVQLQPGQWIVVRVKKTLKCDSTDYCKKFETDESALLRAEWSEYLFTRRHEGCKLNKGSFHVRTIVSKPMFIDFAALPHEESSKTSSDSNSKK